MDNGDKACIDVRDLTIKSNYLYTDDPSNLYKEKLDEFLKLGIKRGESLWLKYPLYGLSSLTQLTVKDTYRTQRHKFPSDAISIKIWVWTIFLFFSAKNSALVHDGIIIQENSLKTVVPPHKEPNIK